MCFETYKNKGSITFCKRGSRLDTLMKMLKEAVKGLTECDRAILQESWIERLIKAAELQGAKMPTK